MPYSGDVVIDMALTGFVRTYPFRRQKFVQREIAKRWPAKSPEGKYKELGFELVDQHENPRISDRSKAAEIGYDMTEATFETEPSRIKIPVSARTIKNAPPGYDPMKQGAFAVFHYCMLYEERQLAALADATTNTTAPANNWDVDAATILDDISDACEAMYDTLGAYPTDIVIPQKVANAMILQQDVLDLIKAAAALQQPMKILSKLRGPNVLPEPFMNMVPHIPNVQYNSAAKGATRVLAPVWSDNVTLYLRDDDSQGSTWAINPAHVDYTIVKWRENDPSGWYVACDYEMDWIEVTSEAVYQLTALLS